MYNYIFWVVYNKNLNRTKSKWVSRHNASGVVFFAVLIHVVFIAECIKVTFKFKNTAYLNPNKFIEGTLGLLCILAIYLFYTESRIAKIANNHLNDKTNGTIRGLIVLALIFIPLSITIILGWKK